MVDSDVVAFAVGSSRCDTWYCKSADAREAVFRYKQDRASVTIACNICRCVSASAVTKQKVLAKRKEASGGFSTGDQDRDRRSVT
mgnify:FL=1